MDDDIEELNEKGSLSKMIRAPLELASATQGYIQQVGDQLMPEA